MGGLKREREDRWIERECEREREARGKRQMDGESEYVRGGRERGREVRERECVSMREE